MDTLSATALVSSKSYPAFVPSQLRKQAERFGADLRYGVATAANLAEAPYKITIDDEKMIEAETLIIATRKASSVLRTTTFR